MLTNSPTSTDDKFVRGALVAGTFHVPSAAFPFLLGSVQTAVHFTFLRVLELSRALTLPLAIDSFAVESRGE